MRRAWKSSRLANGPRSKPGRVDPAWMRPTASPTAAASPAEPLLAEARAGGALDSYPPALAAEAELTARLGDAIRAELLFREAADMATSPAERSALLRRAAEM